MLSGRPPFSGTDAATIYAIENREPPPIAGRSDLPADLGRIMVRALAKVPGERYQTADEFLADLRGLPEDIRPRRKRISIVPSSTWGRLRRRLARVKPWAVALVALGMAAGSVALSLLLKGMSSPPIQLANPRRVTSDQGVEDWPSWSPDGTKLAFATNHRLDRNVWIIDLKTGDSVQRTTQYSGYDGQPSWSPDGSQIAFVSNRD